MLLLIRLRASRCLTWRRWVVWGIPRCRLPGRSRTMWLLLMARRILTWWGRICREISSLLLILAWMGLTRGWRVGWCATGLILIRHCRALGLLLGLRSRRRLSRWRRVSRTSALPGWLLNVWAGLSGWIRALLLLCLLLLLLRWCRARLRTSRGGATI